MPPGTEEGNSPPPINLYDENTQLGNFKVFIQKAENGDIDGRRVGISVLKVAEQIHKITKGKGINEIKKVGRNRIICDCTEANTANNLVLAEELKSLNFKAFIPNFLVSRAVIVKNIDSDFTEERLKNIIDCRQYKIKNIIRLNRRVQNDGEIEYIPTNTVKIFFFGQNFPEYIYIWNARFPCEPFIPATKQCYRCFRFGHLSKQCKSTNEKCFTCGDSGHTKKECKSKEPKCNNCGQAHESTSRNCPERKRQENINTLMATHNMSYQEASLEIPKLRETGNYYSVRTENKFAVLNDENDFPELIGNNQQQQGIPMYVPPPISRHRNFKNNTEIRRLASQKRSRQERSSSTEREEDIIRTANNNKKSREENLTLTTEVEIHPTVNLHPKTNVTTRANQVQNDTTIETVKHQNNDFDKIEIMQQSDDESGELNEEISDKRIEVSDIEKIQQTPRRSTRRRHI